MGIIDWLIKPSTPGSAGLFNQANEHWGAMKTAAFAEDVDRQKQELLEVIRLCQLAVVSDKKAGDAYVMFTNALLIASRIVEEDGRNIIVLRNYAAGIIAKWWSLPHKKFPITKNYEAGLQMYQAVIDEIQADTQYSSQLPENFLTGYERDQGDRATTSDTREEAYEEIRAAISDGRWSPAEQQRDNGTRKAMTISFDDERWHILQEALLEACVHRDDKSKWGALTETISPRFKSVEPREEDGRYYRECKFSSEEVQMIYDALDDAEERWSDQASRSRSYQSNIDMLLSDAEQTDRVSELARIEEEERKAWKALSFVEELSLRGEEWERKPPHR